MRTTSGFAGLILAVLFAGYLREPRQTLNLVKTRALEWGTFTMI